MNKLLLFILLFFSCSFPQSLNINSPKNFKLFADHLFCEKDYLRAADEYERYLTTNSDDTVKFKIALAYQGMDKLIIAENKLADLFHSSLSDAAHLEFYKTLFLEGKYDELQKKYSEEIKLDGIEKLYLLSYFFSDRNLPDRNTFIFKFHSNEVENFYDRKIDPPFKSSVTAGILSALIPGLGKVYTGEIGDGITAFLATGILSYLSYTNFNHHHDFRGWLFGGLGALFYAGNIYGSAASAKVYNAKLSFDFESDVKIFLEKNNYYTPDYNFCGER